MNTQQLQQEVLSCIWSTGLRNYIAEHNYTFTNVELLSIVYHFVPVYDERLRLLRLLAAYVPDVSEIAARCIDFQRECLERFCQHSDNEVYELCIQTDSDSYEERYLCASYQTALDTIDAFYREYACGPAKDTACYVITKRKVLQPTDAFQEDELGACILGAGKVLLSAEIWRDGNDPRDEIEEVAFPDFVPHLSAVRYRKSGNRIERGVCLAGDGLPTESHYVIPFETEMLKSREYDEYLGSHWHEHIPGPNIEVISVSELSEEEKGNYLAFVQYWKQREH